MLTNIIHIYKSDSAYTTVTLELGVKNKWWYPCAMHIVLTDKLNYCNSVFGDGTESDAQIEENGYCHLIEHKT